MTSRESLDASYEEDLQRNPYNLKNWIYYLEFKSEAEPSVRYSIYDRALKVLPRSYKLWHQYLTERVAQCASRCITDPLFEDTDRAFQTALLHMHKMPVIWNLYLSFLLPLHRITFTRRTFDRALRALPITQHAKWIWPLYISFANGCGVPDTCARIWVRYMKVCPEEREAHVDALLSAGAEDAAAVQLVSILNDDKFVSSRGRSRYELWVELLRLLVHSTKVRSVDAPAVIRTAIMRFPHESARMWLALGEFYTRRGLLERTRDVYEEALAAATTVRDVTAVYEALLKHEYALVEAGVQRLVQLEAEADARQAGQEQPNADADADAEPRDPAIKALSPAALSDLLAEVRVSTDLRLDRVEALVARRPWLVNDAILRHNPHIVAEWLVRVQLCGDDRARALKTYAQAVRAVEPEKAVGRLDKLWLGFATVYASAGQLSDARAVLEQAVRVSYASRGHAEHVWCRYAEMEVLHRCYDRALVVLTRATSGDGGTPTVQHSTRLWAFLADITESVHGGDAAAAVYSAMLRARVATPQLVLHHAALLRSLGRPDAVLRLYEQAVSIFRYPSAAPLWLAYLRALHSGRNPSIERTRDVCRQAVAAAPPAHLRPLLLLWARVEEEAGTPRALMRVLQQAVRDVPVQHRLDMYLLYAAKATELFGGVRARAVMEEALQRLPDAQVHVIALRFAAMERRLGDLDRARAIYRFACQVTDPRAHQAFWAVFHAFEAKHGSQETFREMLRLRRATRAQFELAQVNTQSLKAGEEAQREEEAFQEEARGKRKRGEAEEQ